MTESLDVMDALKMVEVASEVLERSAKSGQTPENSSACRMINDLAYWLEDTTIKLALAEKFVNTYYRRAPGVLPPTYEAWRKIKEGDDYKPKIHLVTP